MSAPCNSNDRDRDSYNDSDKCTKSESEFCWCPDDLYIPGEDGNNINLLDTFSLDSTTIIPCTPNPRSPSTYLPVSIYPPTFDGWKIVSNTMYCIRK